jgi:hypothetical protein
MCLLEKGDRYFFTGKITDGHDCKMKEEKRLGTRKEKVPVTFYIFTGKLCPLLLLRIGKGVDNLSSVW